MKNVIGSYNIDQCAVKVFYLTARDQKLRNVRGPCGGVTGIFRTARRNSPRYANNYEIEFRRYVILTLFK